MSLYHNGHDGKEHIALVRGDLAGLESVLVRVHSECFTGDVLGSRRCDCGDQLGLAMARIDEEGRGVLLYLRQEGRGIGLLEKLKAYNLQDEGYDTVDANLLLGHGSDERDYALAALMLADLGVSAVRLITNNPAKIAGLEEHGIEVRDRIPMLAPVSAENVAYLKTKVERLEHLMDPAALAVSARSRAGAAASIRAGDLSLAIEALQAELGAIRHRPKRPFVTLTYAQSVDGSIAATAGEPLALSGPESLVLTHELRAAHDAILVGIGTVLADDPRLNVRLVEASDPQPVVLDSRLRFPLNARLLKASRPWIAAAEDADPGRQERLEAAGARVLRLPSEAPGRIDLEALLRLLAARGISSLMVEGGAGVISSFLASRRVDQLVLTVAPTIVGGLRAVNRQREHVPLRLPRLGSPRYQQLGDDLILWGKPDWSR